MLGGVGATILPRCACSARASAGVISVSSLAAAMRTAACLALLRRAKITVELVRCQNGNMLIPAFDGHAEEILKEALTQGPGKKTDLAARVAAEEDRSPTCLVWHNPVCIADPSRRSS
jgi:hypothetical protein